MASGLPVSVVPAGGFPVTTVANGGLPVTVTSGAFPVTVVAAGALPVTLVTDGPVAPTVTGTPQVGQTLTASTASTWSVGGVARSFLAASATYVPVPQDAGKTVTATAGGLTSTATAAVTNAALPSVSPTIAYGARMVIAGDSIVQQNATGVARSGDATQGAVHTAGYGELTQVLALEARVNAINWYDSTKATATARYTNGSDQGINGNTSSQLQSRFSADILALSPAVVLIAIGTNNTTQQSQIISDITSMVSAARSAGAAVIVATLRPNTTSDTNRTKANIQSINTAIRSYVAGLGDSLVVLWDAYKQYDRGNGYMNPADTYDGLLHPSDAGAELGAWGNNPSSPAPDSLAFAIRRLVQSGDVYADLIAANTNSAPNPTFTGSSAVTGQIAGTRPTSWSYQFNGSASSNVAVSLETNSETGGQSAVAVISPSGSNAYERLALVGSATVSGLAGKWVRCFFEVETDGAPWLMTPQAQLVEYDGGTSKQYARALAPNLTTPGPMRPVARRRKLMTDPFLCDATGATQLQASVQFAWQPSGATGTATVKVRRCWFAIVPNPTTAWTATYKVTTEGDSITYGAGLSSGQDWPSKLAALSGRTVSNIGTSGYTLANMDTNYSTRSGAQYDSSKTVNELFLLGGANDLKFNSATASQLQTWYTSIAGKARTTGFGKIWAGTILPCPDFPSAQQTARTNFNTALRANFAAWGFDGVADYAAQSELSDPSNTTYFQDGLHPTAAGTTVMANVAQATRTGATLPLGISGTPGGGTTGTAYSFTPTVSGGSGTRTFSKTGTLPAGLSFSTSTGAITGTPTTAGTSSGISITVTDSSGSATLSGLSIVVGTATADTWESVFGSDLLFWGEEDSLVVSSGIASAWNTKQSSGGYNAAGTGSPKPSGSTTAGQGATFGGDNGFLIDLPSALPAGTPINAFCVLVFNSASSGGRVVSVADATTAVDYNGQSAIPIGEDGSGGNLWYYQNGGYGTYTGISFSTLYDVAGYASDATNGKISLNGTDASGSTPLSISTIQYKKISIGCNVVSGGEGMHATTRLMVLTKGVPTATQITKAKALLATKRAAG